jgi:hypothetical protein
VGLVGGLVGMGIPEDEAEGYEGEVKVGRTLIIVKAGDRYDDAVNTMRQFGGYEMRARDKTSPVLASVGW